MTWPNSPEWLLELQTRFTALLRTPLDRSSGSLRADTSAYDPALLAAALPNPTLDSAERLAIYHRQYWFRLFTALQGLYPLTARLAGYWHFNDLAAHHLLKRPPRGFDIDTIGDEFELTLAEHLIENDPLALDSRRPVPAAALRNAAQVDAAFQRVTRAPRSEPLRPGPADAPRFDDSCLRLTANVALIREHWPLCEARMALAETPSDAPIPLAAPWPTPRHWLLTQQTSRLGLVALSPREAQLLDLLQQLPLTQALGTLEATTPPAERALLPEATQTWLARSVRLGIWADWAKPRPRAKLPP